MRYALSPMPSPHLISAFPIPHSEFNPPHSDPTFPTSHLPTFNSAIAPMLHALCPMPSALCSLPSDFCQLFHAPCLMPCALCPIFPPSKFRIQFIPHSPFRIPHSDFRILFFPHSNFPPGRRPRHYGFRLVEHRAYSSERPEAAFRIPNSIYSPFHPQFTIPSTL
jgi:hypothetical protein